MNIGYGVTANIAASHAAARGSIPRIRIFFIFFPCTDNRKSFPCYVSLRRFLLHLIDMGKAIQ